MSQHNTHAIRTPKSAMFRRGMTRTAVSLAGGAIVATGMLATGSAANAAGGWDEVAQCESGGDWSINTGNGYYGGLQFSQQTWDAFGGSQYASTADQASKSQQIAIGEKVLAGQGAGAWPNCGSALSGGADTSGAPAESENDDSEQQESQDSGQQEEQKSSDSQQQESTPARESEQKANRSTERQPTEKQGDWSCDGDGIADNCDDNGFTKETEQKQQAEKPAEKPAAPAEAPKAEQPKQSETEQQAPAGEPGSQATGDLSVAGTLDVDGKMGPKTITALQDWLGVEQTGEMNEETTLALQAWAGTEQDGVIGEKTVAGLQHEVGATQNGSDEIDEDTTEVVQTFLNLY
ncbi:transglycosylase family protein [Brachybacterium sp. FME24]|uniref:transglycosylase family protein n=1 Tax=Brachybacterium sp. FME24 TaxID=2742605 RepID=UPI00186946CE|nr:transglycosylase family protein [Brachybacterium sp. FME24]